MSFELVLVAALAVAAFAAAFQASGLMGQVMGAGRLAREAAAVMGDKTLSDEEKEPRVQKAALGLFGAFGRIFLRSILVLVPPIAVLWGADAAGFTTLAELEAFFLDWRVILGTTVLVVLLMYAGRK
ncbi:MAG: hypothetical protein AAF908_06120 [Pseudomonadota bacterium]